MGSVAGGVFGARYMRDYASLAKQLGSDFSKTHPPLPKRAPKSTWAGPIPSDSPPVDAEASLKPVRPAAPDERGHPSDAPMSAITGRPGPVWDDDDDDEELVRMPPAPKVHPQAKPPNVKKSGSATQSSDELK